MTSLNSNDWLIYPFGFDPYILTAECISNTFTKDISVYLKIRINNILICLNSIDFPEYPCVTLKEQYCLKKKKETDLTWQLLMVLKWFYWVRLCLTSECGQTAYTECQQEQISAPHGDAPLPKAGYFLSKGFAVNQPEIPLLFGRFLFGFLSWNHRC